MLGRAVVVGVAALATSIGVFARVRSSSDGDRVAAARHHVEAPMRALFASKGAAYPPQTLYLRAFKREQRLEMWSEAQAGRFVLVKTFPICASSGRLGPKRAEGDEQVPEGFYEVRVFNTKSRFHLSLGIDYPNASDRVLGRAPLGGDIMIHGGCVTIGCIPIEDAGIDEVFVAATDAHAAGHPVVVHVFPTAMTDDAMRTLERDAGGDAALASFWRSLRPAYARFEATRRLPRTRVDRSTGLYVVDESVR
jgi:murein L,D-transpeptidase YafK